MREIVFFQMNDVLLLHQGQACENILAQAFVRYGGQVIECIIDEGLHRSLEHPFIGNMDLKKLTKQLESNQDIAFVRMEAGTNLIGGQPFSLEHAQQVAELCKSHKVGLVLDASHLTDNVYFMKIREEQNKEYLGNQLSACSLS